mgnify:CR=1 FL=1
MNIRRYYSPGQVVFITQVVKDRQRLFEDESLICLLWEVVNTVQNYHPFSVLAYVLLPDHFHLLMKPKGGSNFSQIMHSIKRNFTFEYKRRMNIQYSISLWQRRFWDHVIRNEDDFENHFHYIHNNPVKHGYVNKIIDWKFSSFLDWQQRGVYEKWNGWEEPDDVSWGE